MTRPLVRLRPAPQCEPPFDDEPEAATWLAAGQLASVTALVPRDQRRPDTGQPPPAGGPARRRGRHPRAAPTTNPTHPEAPLTPGPTGRPKPPHPLSDLPSQQLGSQLTAQPRGPLTAQPGSQLTTQPGSQLTARPGSQLTARPGSQLTAQPGSQLTAQPGSQLTAQPGSQLTAQPGSQLTAQPGDPLTARLGGLPAAQPGGAPPAGSASGTQVRVRRAPRPGGSIAKEAVVKRSEIAAAGPVLERTDLAAAESSPGGSETIATEVPRSSVDARLAVRRFVGACVEVLNGYRPAAHLRRLALPMEASRVVAQAIAGAHRVAELRSEDPQRQVPRARRRPAPVAVLRVRLCEPRPGAIEASVILLTGERTWALALRLELHEDDWVATTLRLI